jgi:hypothetical protein
MIVGKRTEKTEIDLRGFCNPSNNLGCDIVFFFKKKELHLLSKAISSTKILYTGSTERNNPEKKTECPALSVSLIRCYLPLCSDSLFNGGLQQARQPSKAQRSDSWCPHQLVSCIVQCCSAYVHQAFRWW